MGIQGRQLIAELNGISCWPLEKHARKPKSIAVTRTFGTDTNNPHVLEAAITTFATKAAFRLRSSNQLTRKIGFFMTTNRHKPGYKNISAETTLTMPSADTGTLIEQAINLMMSHFRPQLYYHRAGVWLHDFVPDKTLQIDLFGNINTKLHHKSISRMQAIDSINNRYGKHTVYYASESLGSIWQPKNNIKMPCYTTHWDELPFLKV
jgi:DNA polymerase V